MNELEEFGKELVEKVRDYTIEDLVQISNGKMKSEQAVKMSELINSGDSKLINEVVKYFIDRTIHNFLWMFEMSEDFSLVAKPEELDLAEESDGLTGELYDESGWIQKFSKYTP